MRKEKLLILLFSAICLPLAVFGHDRDARKKIPNKTQKRTAAESILVSKTSICPEILSLSMDPGQEVPPVNSTAAGACVGLLLADRTNLTISCTHNVVDANAAHIHTGAVGVSGPVVCPAANASNPLTISCSLDSTLRAALEAGNLYVNVHSPTFPAGEVRGQIPLPLTACSSSSASGDVSQSGSSSSSSSLTY